MRVTKVIKEYLKKYPILYRQLRLAKRFSLAQRKGYYPWDDLLEQNRREWKEALKISTQGQKVLFASSVGAHYAAMNLEGLLSVALTLRGAKVHFLLCDAALPACLDDDITWYPKMDKFVNEEASRDLCRHCFAKPRKIFEEIGLPVHSYGAFLSEEDRKWASEKASQISLFESRGFVENGVRIGEHALAGTLRFFAKASLDDEPYALPVFHRYLQGALLTQRVIERVLSTQKFDVVVLQHGIYIPQGVLSAVCRQRGVRVVSWNPAYRKRSFIFSHEDTYHHTLMSEPSANWENLEWSPSLEKKTIDYISSRWQGTDDWIWFHEKGDENLDDYSRTLGIDWSRPTIGLLTNVMWDAELHYDARAFPSMIEWLTETISYFSGRPDLQLLVRIHPAEIRGTLPSRQPVMRELQKRFPQTAKNIFIIPPEARVSTYSAMSRCNAIIIYATKMGVEFSALGNHIIVAGEAWVRNKGITRDTISREDYFTALSQLPYISPPQPVVIDRAKKYAYHFFFRRMIPIEYFTPLKGNPPYGIALHHLDELRPGKSSGLDVICDGILKERDFIYPAERY